MLNKQQYKNWYIDSADKTYGRPTEPIQLSDSFAKSFLISTHTLIQLDHIIHPKYKQITLFITTTYHLVMLKVTAIENI